jgi:hypothetical protein
LKKILDDSEKVFIESIGNRRIDKNLCWKVVIKMTHFSELPDYMSFAELRKCFIDYLIEY